MVKKTSYKAAAEVSAYLFEHFVRQLPDTVVSGGWEEHLPSPDEIEYLIDVAFWASLLKEEGIPTKISLAFLSPKALPEPMLFENSLPLTSHVLTKLSPGFARAGIHIGVWRENGELYIWGATHQIPGYCFVLDVPEPGLLVIKHQRLEGFGKFTNVAVLNGDEIKIVDERSASLPDCPSLLTSLLGLPKFKNGEAPNVLIQLAVSMRAHGRGGTLIIVPKGTSHWQLSIRLPLVYAVAPAFEGLSKMMDPNMEAKNQRGLDAALAREIDALAGLTAIDGAIILNDRYELLAFGAKIIRAEGSELVQNIQVTEPIKGGTPVLTSPGQSGGTRHSSAAQFVHDQHDALALVASQDGRFTVFSWSHCEKIVQAHRIEVLLL